MRKLELNYEPETIRELLGLMVVFSVIATVFLVVGVGRNASAALFLGSWALMVAGLVTFGSLRLAAIKGMRAMPLGTADRAALLCFQVGGALGLILVLVR